MRLRRFSRVASAGAMALAGACARPASTAPAPAPATVEEAAPGAEPLPAERRAAFPPIPRVSGPLALRVQYPSANALIAVRDSNFLLGSVGTGDATLTINGAPVRVEPNGAFVAWLPVPRAGAPRYELVAIAGADTQRVSHSVRLPSAAVMALEGPLAIDTATRLAGGYALRDEEPQRLAIGAPANATVVWQYPGGEQALVNAGGTWSLTVPSRLLRARSQIMVVRGADTVRVPVERVDPLDSLSVVVLGDSAAIAASDSDRVVIGRPIPGETYKWFFLPGTMVQATGRVPGYTRVRLDNLLEVWVAAADARPMPGRTIQRVTTSSARVRSTDYGADVVIPATATPAYQLRDHGTELVLTLYGAQGTGDRTRYPGTEAFVRTVDWSQETSDRVLFTIRLARPVLGYHVVWERNALVLRLRTPPRVRESRPLEGVLVAVDPGHPPAGTTGPTGFYEGDAVLAVAHILRDMLLERGARVLMTRETRDTVPLAARPVMARRANAHALVSIHLNALPDGVNPLVSQGTETYFFHPHAEQLARAIHIGMLREFGLPDRGTFTRDLAMARPTWMPSVLAEAAYLILADAEAAMRTPEGQRLYARALLEGLETFFRSFAR